MAPRSFRLTSGTIDRFWTIAAEGPVLWISSGRCGTVGMRVDRTFPDGAAAQAFAAGQIATRLAEGYVEGPVPPPTNHAVSAAMRRAKGPRAKPVAEAAPASPPMTADAAPVARIALAPEDLLAVPWRMVPPVPPQEPAPFDQAACCARLATVRTEYHGQVWRFEELAIPSVMTAREAVFWFLAMAQQGADDGHGGTRTPAAVAAELATAAIPEALPVERIATTAQALAFNLGPATVLPLCRLLTPAQLTALVVERGGLPAGYRMPLANIVPGIITTRLRPHLDDATTTAFRDAIRPHLTVAGWRAANLVRDHRVFLFAAAFGMTRELAALFAGLERADLAEVQHYAFQVLLALEPAEATRQALRLRLLPTDGRQARQWLATTGLAGLAALAEAVITQDSRDLCREWAAVLALAEAPEAAPRLLAVREQGRARTIARAWFARHPAHGLAGLAGMLDGSGALPEAAREWVRQLRRRGGHELIAAVAARLPPAEGGRLRDLSAAPEPYPPFPAGEPAWFVAALGAALSASAARPKALPEWADPDWLPSLTSCGSRLTDDQVRAVLAALRDPDSGAPLLAALKRHADPVALDRFVWRLFSEWQADDAPAAHKWAMLAMGVLGGDGCVQRLTPLIRAWPGESQHARAVAGLGILRAIGSDVALMQLNGIAQKLPFKALKAKAERCMAEIAWERGLSRDGLADRVVPDCGLDARGERAFAVGQRQFTFVLGPELKPLLRDAAGRLHPSLPRPGAKDDAVLAAAAAEEWKILRKQVADTVAVQSGRLEQAMIIDRRWPVAEFRALLVDHPLLIHLVRRLVWAGYAADGARRALFRIDDERAAVDHEERPADLATATAVGVVHPARLSAAERGAWGQVLADYGIVQPFPQLLRPVHAALPAELAAGRFIRLHGVVLPAPVLVYGLDKLGWRRGSPEDGGSFNGHAKEYPAAGITAVVTYSGNVAMGWIEPDERLTIEDCHLVRGEPGRGVMEQPLPLAEVDPVVVSETLNDLLRLAAKATET